MARSVRSAKPSMRMYWKMAGSFDLFRSPAFRKAPTENRAGTTVGSNGAAPNGAVQARKRSGAAPRRRKNGAVLKRNKNGAAPGKRRNGAAQKRNKNGAAPRKKRNGVALKRNKNGAAPRKRRSGVALKRNRHLRISLNKADSD